MLDGLAICKGASPVFECKSYIYDSLVTKNHTYDCERCLQYFLCMWFNMPIILEERIKNSHLVSLIHDLLQTSVALWYGLIYPMQSQCILR